MAVSVGAALRTFQLLELSIHRLPLLSDERFVLPDDAIVRFDATAV